MKIGDVVCLKSDVDKSSQVAMTVVGVFEGYIRCLWTRDGEVVRDDFPPACLASATPGNLRLWYYQGGNQLSRDAVAKAAADAGGRNILIPRFSGVEKVEMV